MMGDDQASRVDRRGLLRLSGLATAGAVGAVGASMLPSAPAGAAPLGYNVITPYRSFDTRENGPDYRLFSNEVFDWDLWTGSDGVGRIPSGAAAVTFNLTITETLGAAFLAVVPADGAYQGISTINWTSSGVTLANGGTVKLGPSDFSGPGSVSVYCGGANAGTHYIIDVTGYYG